MARNVAVGWEEVREMIAETMAEYKILDVDGFRKRTAELIEQHMGVSPSPLLLMRLTDVFADEADRSVRTVKVEKLNG